MEKVAFAGNIQSQAVSVNNVTMIFLARQTYKVGFNGVCNFYIWLYIDELRRAGAFFCPEYFQ